MADRPKLGLDRAGRDPSGRFRPGHGGRPRGTRNKASVAVETLMEGEAKALARKAVDRALAGDAAALKLCLDRVAPPSRERRLSFAMPTITSAADLPAALAAVALAVSRGELSPAEGAAVASLIERTRQAHETVDLENRIRDLEARDKERRL
jgi:hypothetical protein